MNAVLILIGSAIFLYSSKFPGKCSALLQLGLDRGRIWFNSFTKTPELDQESYLLVSRILSHLRAGHSLDSSLHQLLKEETLSPNAKIRLESVLSQQANGDPLSRFLATALASGCSLLDPLQIYLEFLNSKRKLYQKSYAITSQYRAQATVLSWLPVALFFVVLCFDPSMVWQVIQSQVSLVVLSFSLTLLGAGRIWIKKIIEIAQKPTTFQEEYKNTIFPEFLLQMIGTTSLGVDSLTAFEQLSVFFRKEHPKLMSFIEKNSAGNLSDPHFQLKQLVVTNSQHGGPILGDLKLLLSNHFSEQESFWEAKVQRLPVLLLAPLFLCFFPSCLLLLFAILIPFLQEVV